MIDLSMFYSLLYAEALGSLL